MTARVPVVVIGLPVTVNQVGVVSATDDTVPELLGGVAKVPSALRKLVVPPPLAGTAPLSDDVKVLTSVVNCVAVIATGAALEPETLPTTVAVAWLAKEVKGSEPVTPLDRLISGKSPVVIAE